MAERYFDGGWHRDIVLRGFQFVPAGYYEEGVEVTPTKFLSDTEAGQLIPVLDHHGLLMPRLDTRLRDEDLKITHRLMDLLGQSIGGAK